MARSIKLPPFRDALDLRRDPRLTVRLLIGALLLANLVALYFVWRPLGGSPEELDTELTSLQQQVLRRRVGLQQLRGLVGNVERARDQGDTFLQGHFLDRVTAASTLEAELRLAAQKANMTFKEHSINVEPIEGSDDLSMLTISANYEGTYRNLLALLNEMDRSPRLLIVENLTAAPQQGSAALRVAMRLRMFMREAR